MSSTLESAPADSWLLPVLREILPQQAIGQIESTVGISYWRTAVDRGLARDEDIIKALSTRTHFRVATDLLVSSEACEKVPEARRTLVEGFVGDAPIYSLLKHPRALAMALRDGVGGAIRS